MFDELRALGADATIALTADRDALEAAPRAGFRVATRTLPLADVAAAWDAGGSRSRVVRRP